MSSSASCLPLPDAGRRLRACLGGGLPRLVLVLDRRLTDPLAAVAAMPKGTGVLVRAPTAQALAVLAEAVMPVARRRGLTVLISGDWRLAARVKADGLHLPETMARRGCLAPLMLWRRRTGGAA